MFLLNHTYLCPFSFLNMHATTRIDHSQYGNPLEGCCSWCEMTQRYAVTTCTYAGMRVCTHLFLMLARLLCPSFASWFDAQSLLPDWELHCTTSVGAPSESVCLVLSRRTRAVALPPSLSLLHVCLHVNTPVCMDDGTDGTA